MNTLYLSNIHFSTNALLLSIPRGLGSFFLLFLLCFIGVHLAKIAARGWRLYDETFNAQQEKSTPPEPTKNEQKPPDAVYYIVEKKRRRSRPSYGDPKEFRFK